MSDLFDAARNLIGGSGRETMPFELNKGETEILRVVASQRPGTLTSVGGDLVLTSQRLLFTPLNTGDVSKLLAFSLEQAGVDGHIVSIVGKVQDMIGTAAPIGPGALIDLADVSAGANGSWFKAPTVIVRGIDGRSTEIAVLAGRLKLNRDPENRPVRDKFIEAVQQQMTV